MTDLSIIVLAVVGIANYFVSLFETTLLTTASYWGWWESKSESFSCRLRFYFEIELDVTTFIIVVLVLMLLVIVLLLPSLAALITRRNCIPKHKEYVDNVNITACADAAQSAAAAKKVTAAYAQLVDGPAVMSYTRMLLALFAVVIVGIGLFLVLTIASDLGMLVATPGLNETERASISTMYNSTIQLATAAVAILGTVLSAAVGFYFGVQSEQKKQNNSD